MLLEKLTKVTRLDLRGPWVLLWVLLLFEALLSVLNLAAIPGINDLTRIIGDVVPVVDHFLVNPRVDPSVGPYIAITVLLMPLKVWAGYLIASNLSGNDRQKILCFPSSNASLVKKCRDSFLALLMVTVVVAIFADWGNPDYQSPLNLRSLRIGAGGLKAWWYWSVGSITIVAVCVGVIGRIIKEWFDLVSKKDARAGLTGD